MGSSLTEYAAQHGQGTMPENDREQAAALFLTAQERQQRAEEAGRLKEIILQQMQEGSDPQTVLYTALKCIAGLTADPEFFNQGETHLQRIYGDLAQQSFVADNAAIAAARLEKQQAEYLEKLQRTINHKKAGLARIERTMNEIAQQINSLIEKVRGDNQE